MTISVTQLNNYIKGILDMDGVLNDLSVAGEVTNAKRSRDGWYFSLKDETSAIDCFCYATIEPVAGSTVIAEGKLNFWAKSGRLSFFVRRMTVSQNLGAQYLKFLELKDRLQKEGLFDEARKRPVPKCCPTVGVVTSETGAVITDIVTVVHRRQPFSNVILYPVKVQGVGADEEIAHGIEYFSHSEVDVVIVGRGGGSNEDLSVFNSEVVVRAVAQCQKPIVSAVGHGVDYTLCDFAADKRAVTPTEAGEFVTIDSALTKQAIILRLQKLSAHVSRQLAENKQRTLYSLKSVNTQIAHTVERHKAHVVATETIFRDKISATISQRRLQLEKVLSRLSSANPANVLKRGFAYVDVDGKRISSVNQVSTGDNVTVTLADGNFQARVNKKESK